MNRDTHDEFDGMMDDGLDAARGIVWWTLAVIAGGVLAWWWIA